MVFILGALAAVLGRAFGNALVNFGGIILICFGLYSCASEAVKPPEQKKVEHAARAYRANAWATAEKDVEQNVRADNPRVLIGREVEYGYGDKGDVSYEGLRGKRVPNGFAVEIVNDSNVALVSPYAECVIKNERDDKADYSFNMGDSDQHIDLGPHETRKYSVIESPNFQKHLEGLVLSSATCRIHGSIDKNFVDDGNYNPNRHVKSTAAMWYSPSYDKIVANFGVDVENTGDRPITSVSLACETTVLPDYEPNGKYDPSWQDLNIKPGETKHLMYTSYPFSPTVYMGGVPVHTLAGKISSLNASVGKWFCKTRVSVKGH